MATRLLSRLWTRVTICVCYSIGIAVLSLLPNDNMPGSLSIPHADKIAHFVVYGLYAGALLWMIGKFERAVAPVTSLMGAVLWCASYGGVMEILQRSLTADRVFSVGDLVANAAGAAVCAIVYFCVQRRGIRQT
jgi:VanZ family protein